MSKLFSFFVKKRTIQDFVSTVNKRDFRYRDYFFEAKEWMIVEMSGDIKNRSCEIVVEERCAFDYFVVDKKRFWLIRIFSKKKYITKTIAMQMYYFANWAGLLKALKGYKINFVIK